MSADFLGGEVVGVDFREDEVDVQSAVYSVHEREVDGSLF